MTFAEGDGGHDDDCQAHQCSNLEQQTQKSQKVVKMDNRCQFSFQIFLANNGLYCIVVPGQIFPFQGIQSYSNRKILFFLFWSCRNFLQSVSSSPSSSWSSPPQPPARRPKQRWGEWLSLSFSILLYHLSTSMSGKYLRAQQGSRSSSLMFQNSKSSFLINREGRS